MSSSPRFQGAPLAGDRVVLRGAEAAQLRPALLAQDSSFSASVTAAGVREDARAEGYATGWAEGSKAARATVLAHAARAAEIRDREEGLRSDAFRSAIAALSRGADDLERRALPLAEEIESALVSAAFAMAEAIVGRELATSANPGRDALVRAVAVAPHGQPVRVRLHPSDAAALAGLTANDMTALTGRDVQLVSDVGISRGDAIADCGATRIDAGLASASHRVRQALGL